MEIDQFIAAKDFIHILHMYLKRVQELLFLKHVIRIIDAVTPVFEDLGEKLTFSWIEPESEKCPLSLLLFDHGHAPPRLTRGRATCYVTKELPTSYNPEKQC